MLYDPGHMVHEGMEQYKLGIEMLRPYLHHVHAKNAGWVRKDGKWVCENMSLQDGMVDWKAVFDALKEVGYDAQGYLEFDQEGFVFGRPDQVELDVVLKDDKLILIEIKSSLSWEEVHTFQRKVEFYERKEGRRADRKIIIAPFVEGERPFEVARRLGIEIFTNVNDMA